MKIIITDSGLGGLSVAAALYETLKINSVGGVEIIFANALPETGKGYNKMPNRTTKMIVFNSALEGFYRYFKPDLISVACNTLSVLLEFTDFAKKHSEMISDVVITGIHGFLKSSQILPNENLVIFGTETTIKSRVHANQFYDTFYNRICAIHCSGLASAIEMDFQSRETENIIRKAVEKIPEKMNSNKTYAYLACTHYGYVSNLFLKLIMDQDFENVEIVDPNIYLEDFLFEKIVSNHKPIENQSLKINVFSRCQILESEINSISHLVKSISKDTVLALKEYKIIEELF